MKFRWLFIPLGIIAVGIASAQSISSPPGGISIFSTGTLTNVYTATTVLDVQSYDSVSVLAATVTTQALAVANLKPQWSHDSSTWSDVPVLTAASVVGTETPYTITSKQVTYSLTNGAPNYVEVFPRNARYFRILVKSTNAFTSGTINITAQKLNNNSGQN